MVKYFTSILLATYVATFSSHNGLGSLKESEHEKKLVIRMIGDEAIQSPTTESANLALADNVRTSTSVSAFETSLSDDNLFQPSSDPMKTSNNAEITSQKISLIQSLRSKDEKSLYLISQMNEFSSNLDTLSDETNILRTNPGLY